MLKVMFFTCLVHVLKENELPPCGAPVLSSVRPRLSIVILEESVNVILSIIPLNQPVRASGGSKESITSSKCHGG
jgi:hypothetical protein